MQRFDGSALLLGPKGKKIKFKDGVTLLFLSLLKEEKKKGYPNCYLMMGG
jgi:hypothetical protein